MSEEMQSQPTPSMSAPVQPAAPTTPVPAPESAPKKSRSMLLVFSAIVVVAVILLAAAGYFYYKNNNNKNLNAYAPTNTAANYATPSAQAVSPTPVVSVESSSDLDKVVNELNSTDDSALQSDLNQANSEGNNL